MDIYVGNLSFDAQDNDLSDTFKQYGDVASINIITDRETGRSRGFAFVSMPNSDEANTAIESLNGQELLGRTLNVREATPRQERPQGGGGRGGFNRGGGRGGRGGRDGGGRGRY